MIAYLVDSGESEAKIKALPLEELEGSYEKKVKAMTKERQEIIREFLPQKDRDKELVLIQDENEILRVRELYDRVVEAVRNDREDIYGVLEEMVLTLSKKEVDDILDSLVQERWYGEFYQMYKVKLRELEEWYLDRIEEFIKSLNEEEKYIIVSDLKRKRADLDYLKSMLKMLEDKESRERFVNISDSRYTILTEFYEDSAKEEYEPYYEEHIYKHEIIEKINKVTKNYRQEELERKSSSELKHIYEHYQREREEAKNEKRKINKFITLLKDAIADGSDEKALGKIIGTMFVELDNKSIERIIEIVYDVSPSVGERIRSSYTDSYVKKKK